MLDVELSFFGSHLERLAELFDCVLLVDNSLCEVIAQQILKSLRLLVLRVLHSLILFLQGRYHLCQRIYFHLLHFILLVGSSQLLLQVSNDLVLLNNVALLLHERSLQFLILIFDIVLFHC